MKTSAAKFTRGAQSANSLPPGVNHKEATAKIDAFLKAKKLHMDCSAWKRRKTA